MIGQSAPGNDVEIPILGDLSRKHARIRRVGEGYAIDPLHSVRIDGRPITEPAPLRDGQEIELGNGVKLLFRRPHPLSQSARLEFVSSHRTRQLADGVLLMAASCVLGPNWTNHVVCRDWSSDAVLYYTDGQLHCRTTSSSLEIDGEPYQRQGPLPGNARVVGGDFSLSIEELDKC